MIKTIRLFSAELRSKCVLLAFFAIIGAYASSLLPIKLGDLLDHLVLGNATMIRLIIGFGALFLGNELLNIFRRVAADQTAARFQEDIRNRSILKLLKLPIGSLQASGASGELTSKINQAIEGSVRLLVLFSNDVLPAFFTAIFVIWQCIGQAPPIIALVMLGYITATISASLLQIRSQKGIREDILRQKTRLDGEVCQSINGVEQIRALSAEEYEVRRLAPRMRSIRVTECRHHITMGLFDAVKAFLKVVFFIAVLFIGLMLVHGGHMTGGGVIAVVLLYQQLIKPIDEFYRFLDEVSSSMIKAKMLREIMELPSDKAFTIQSKGDEPTDNKILFTDCAVSSPDCSKILTYCDDLRLNACFLTALTGKSGSGKSSLIRGLMRYYPSSGNISLFGMDHADIPQSQLITLLHYIPQSPYFFAGSVRENLIYGLKDIPCDDKLRQALTQACIHNELVRDYDPLEYDIHEGAKNLSGGQVKRLALARAFLRSPKLFLLDETLANLDPVTVKRLIHNLKAYADEIGAGVLIISHEPHIIECCDYGIRLEKHQPGLAV